ncbi:hypothetical protein [Brevundimonas vesicularis]|uniref:hypothetical protein n=1 Tax=Brevundimonas vesicularis TaxID=41276 RepID=UPI0022AC020E|nr:hypothetical protein [Brevundimonas vesicularis]
MAHSIGDQAEQAYRRGDALERRRAMMEDWAKHCVRGRASDDQRPEALEPSAM